MGTACCTTTTGKKVCITDVVPDTSRICRMKSLAQSYIWWPSMDSDVEQMAHTCNECSSNQKSPAKAPLHPWEWPSQPWFHIHLDYAGPFMGKMFLIIVDAHSKWIDVHPTSSSPYLFIYLGFYIAFNTVQVISRRVVGRAEETSTYSSLGFCSVNCRPTASNYQLYHLRP